MADEQSAAFLIDTSATVLGWGSFAQHGELSRSALASGGLLPGKHLPGPACSHGALDSGL